jgi:hypothetical protein
MNFVLKSFLLLLVKIIFDGIRRKVKAPVKPFLTCCLDALCAYPQAFKWWVWGKPNDVNRAITLAMQQTGLNDLGGMDGGVAMIERYQTARQLGMERSKVEYSPLGYYMALEAMVSI